MAIEKIKFLSNQVHKKLIPVWLTSPLPYLTTPDEVGNVAALLMGSDGGFITGSDILMNVRVTAAYWYGELAPQ